jgi:hypothetical protein
MPANQLVKYDAACRALSACRRVDEVKRIRDEAIAMKLAAKIAKNKTLEDDAFAIRTRAERRLGELIDMQRKTVGLSKGATERGTKRGTTRGILSPASLAEAGIDKDLAKRARSLAGIEDKAFEKAINGRHTTPLMGVITALADAAVKREFGDKPPKLKVKVKAKPWPKPDPLYDPWSMITGAVEDIAKQDRSAFKAIAGFSRTMETLDPDIEEARKAVVRLAQWLSALQWEKKNGKAS